MQGRCRVFAELWYCVAFFVLLYLFYRKKNLHVSFSLSLSLFPPPPFPLPLHFLSRYRFGAPTRCWLPHSLAEGAATTIPKLTDNTRALRHTHTHTHTLEQHKEQRTRLCQPLTLTQKSKSKSKQTNKQTTKPTAFTSFNRRRWSHPFPTPTPPTTPPPRSQDILLRLSSPSPRLSKTALSHQPHSEEPLCHRPTRPPPPPNGGCPRARFSFFPPAPPPPPSLVLSEGGGWTEGERGNMLCRGISGDRMNEITIVLFCLPPPPRNNT